MNALSDAMSMASGKRQDRARPGPRPWRLVGQILQSWGLFLALILAVGLFGLLRPAAFLSFSNALSILTLAAPLMIAALGLTTALIMNEIDLSVGSIIGLGGVFAVCLMSYWGVPWWLAICAALALAATAGLATGLMVTVAGANSLIITLGMATLLTGIEFSLTNQRTIYSGIDPVYVAFGQSLLLGVNVQVWIAACVALVMWVFLDHSEVGRYMYATGSNKEAAKLAGLPVNRLRIAGFVFVAVLGAISGILLTAQSASAFSNAGQPYLLPAFASAFLGSTMAPDGRFTVKGTLVAVLFIGVVQTGLTMLQLSTGAINVAQGGLLILAVLLSRIGRRFTR